MGFRDGQDLNHQLSELGFLGLQDGQDSSREAARDAKNTKEILIILKSYQSWFRNRRPEWFYGQLTETLIEFASPEFAETRTT